MTSLNDKNIILSIIKEAVSKGSRKSKICELVNIPIRTVQRWEISTNDNRQYRNYIPKNKLSPLERQRVIDICCSKRFVDKSPKEIVPILAEEGIYIASEATIYRILREERMMSYRENTKFPTKRYKPKELKATGTNQVWSWDITYLRTKIKGLFYYLYLFMDVWSRKIVAWDIFEEQSSENAKDIITKIDSNIDLRGIYLHSDNGSPMKGATFLSTLQWLGIIPSFSRPSCSNDNPFSESLFKTLKYKINYPKTFNNIDEVKKWMERFVNWYNNEHRHSGIQYVTPNQRHTGLDKSILEKRKLTYKKAMDKNPERWSKKITRKWNWESIEILNPETKNEKYNRRQIA